MSEVVSYEVVDRVAHVTIERPEVKNAMSLEVFDQLTDRAEQAAADDRVGAVLVRGRDGVFSSGLDVSVFAAHDSAEDGEEELTGEGFIARLQRAFTAYEDIDKPTVACIEGYCFGGGIQLAAACHLRAVAPDAQLSVLEARWALVPDLGGSWRLPRLVGLGRATELTLTARRVDADEALAIGLAEWRLGGDDPVADAHERTAALAAGPGSVRRAPRLLRENLERDRAAALRVEAETQLACLSGPDFTEAVTASLERRDPRFTGA
ncbi:MAG: enoyl-CoA hydratase-related protein [Nitriliruptor sp.]|uniref:enoyl-CoA hydratase/isomerase family protein n=1 Tax=Nitriliruptor sp. TaxID=2448056 RepID=UPI0034A00043